MKLLVLGGTVFLGRHIVEQALLAGHDVTLFNRGQSNAELFEGQVEKIIGNRETDLGKLDGMSFDACIDPSGYIPGPVGSAARALKDRINRYVFVSSISAYSNYDHPGMDESAALAVLPEGVDQTHYDVEHYGPLKVMCEQAAEAEMPGSVLQVRSGLIVGPYDPTNRFTYWPARIAKGGQVLCPPEDFPVQIIHAADQARWILHMLETDQMGEFNVISDQGTYTMGDIVNAAIKASGSNAIPVYASSEFLLEQKVGPWMEFPLWLPESHINMSLFNAGKAIASGMTLMPLEEIVSSTLEWFQGEPQRDWPAGLDETRERELLETLNNQ